MDAQEPAAQRAPERPAPIAPPPPPPRRPFRSTLALTAATILLLIGLVLSFAAFASLSQPARPELGPAFAMTGLVSMAALLVVGVLNVAAALGTYLRMGWARSLGMALAGLGIVGAMIFLVGPLTSFRVPLIDPLMLATIGSLIGYVFSLFALLVAGIHFRRRTTE